MTDRGTERVRERAIGRLQRGYVGGSLGTQTFEYRVETALSCDTPSVLRRLTSDLVSPTLLDSARRWLTASGEPPSSGLLAVLAAGSSTVIGRSSGCDFVISHNSISRRHAMLTRDGDRVIVTDLGSTNGTFVNGRWITQAEVLPGDKLQLGQLDLVL
ncbi:MAG TPA: FHA domain-containing protein [Solirubrobacteraceae bacterium]|nr:FHA domain-containing protein [Solirubrobacteraceae bacterium]